MYRLGKLVDFLFECILLLDFLFLKGDFDFERRLLNDFDLFRLFEFDFERELDDFEWLCRFLLYDFDFDLAEVFFWFFDFFFCCFSLDFDRFDFFLLGELLFELFDESEEFEGFFFFLLLFGLELYFFIMCVKGL